MKNKEYGKVFPLCLLYCTSMLAGKICFAAKKSFCRKSSTSFTRRKLLSFKLSLFNLCLDHKKTYSVCLFIYTRAILKLFLLFFAQVQCGTGQVLLGRDCVRSQVSSQEGYCLQVFLKGLSHEKGIVYRYS